MRRRHDLVILLSLVLVLDQSNFSNTQPIMGHNVEPVGESEFPFVVSLAQIRVTHDQVANHFCAGTLISKKHVLTATECLRDQKKENVEIVAGSTNLRNQNKLRKFSISEWISFEDWFLQIRRNILANNDKTIAIITLNTEDTFIAPAKFSLHVNDDLVGAKVIFTGWGEIDTAIRPDRSQKVTLTVLSRADCVTRIQRSLPPGAILSTHNNFVCALPKHPALGAPGDSGNPLLDKDARVVGVYTKSGVLVRPRRRKYEQNHLVIAADINNQHYKDFIDYICPESTLITQYSGNAIDEADVFFQELDQGLNSNLV